MRVLTGPGTWRRTWTSAMALLSGVVILGPACSGDGPLPPTQRLNPQQLHISPTQIEFSAVGDSASVEVQGSPSGSVAYSVTDPTIATVTPTGTIRAVSDGQTWVITKVGGWTDSASVKVAPRATQLVVTPAVDTLTAIGATARLTVKFYDRNGKPAKGGAVAWSSTDPGIVAVDQSGNVTAVQPGAADVLAQSGALQDFAHIVVLQQVYRITITPLSASLLVGQHYLFTATAIDAKGYVVSAASIAWSSLAPAIASVNNGDVLGVSAGSTQVKATAGTKSASATIQVNAVPVAAVQVNPSTLALLAGATGQLTAQPVDASGQPLSGRTITWASSDAAAATVSASGLVTGVAAGSASITATSEGQTGSSSVTITAPAAPTPAPVASVTVTPSTATLQVGGTIQLAAATLDSAGNPLTGRAVTWSTSSSAVATVSATGLVTAVAAGSAAVTATSEGKQSQAAITVAAPSPPSVASVTVSPASGTLNVGGTLQLNATARDSAGNVLTGRTATWLSSAPAVASVSASGLVTGVAGGAASITATIDGKSAAAAITVTVPVASVTVTPSPDSLRVGQSRQLTATPKDSKGNVLTGRAIRWASSAPSIVSVSTTGIITALALGSAVVSASCDSVVGVAQVAALPAPVASVTVSPATAAIQTGSTVQLTATAKDSAGNTVPNASVTWNSSAPSIASVTSSGLAAGVSVGTANVMATVNGKTGSAVVTVTSPPPPPPPPTGGGTLASDDWQGYAAQPDAPMSSLAVASDLYQAKMGFGDGTGGDALAAKLVAVVTDPSGIFGKVLRYTFPQRTTPYNAEGRQAITPSDKVWFKVLLRFRPGWTDAGTLQSANSYKVVFETWETADQRSEIEYSNTTNRLIGFSQGGRSFSEDAYYGEYLSGAIGDESAGKEWSDGDWREIIIAFEKTSATTYRTSYWWRKYTVRGVQHGLTWAQTAANPSLYDQHFAAWTGRLTSGPDISRVAGIAMGINKNQNTAQEMYLYWGPYVAVDGSQNPDPFGVVGLIH